MVDPLDFARKQLAETERRVRRQRVAIDWLADRSKLISQDAVVCLTSVPDTDIRILFTVINPIDGAKQVAYLRQELGVRESIKALALSGASMAWRTHYEGDGFSIDFDAAGFPIPETCHVEHPTYTMHTLVCGVKP